MSEPEYKQLVEDIKAALKLKPLSKERIKRLFKIGFFK